MREFVSLLWDATFLVYLTVWLTGISGFGMDPVYIIVSYPIGTLAARATWDYWKREAAHVKERMGDH